jgi:hypothetical protein
LPPLPHYGAVSNKALSRIPSKVTARAHCATTRGRGVPESATRPRSPERVGISPPPLTRLTKTQWHARVDRIHPPRFPVSINLCPISLHFLPPATPRPVPFALSLHIPVHRNTLKFVSEKLTGFRFREERRDASATEETRFKAVQEIYEDVMKTRAEQKEVPKRAKLECRRAESGLRNLDA